MGEGFAFNAWYIYQYGAQVDLYYGEYLRFTPVLALADWHRHRR